MKQVVIENPVINSPFREPGRHFKFTDDGITNEVIDGRRSSSYFVPIARPRKKGQKQLEFDTEWTQDRIEENKLVNQIRTRVKLWREGGYIGVTPTTSRLLAYWTDPDCILWIRVRCPQCVSQDCPVYESFHIPVRYHKCRTCGPNFKRVESNGKGVET